MIQLDDNFRITIDSSRQNFQLEKLTEIKDKKTGNIKYDWVNVGFFGHNFKSLLERYKNEAILNEEQDVHINQVLNKLVEIDKHINKAINAAKIKLVSKNDES